MHSANCPVVSYPIGASGIPAERAFRGVDELRDTAPVVWNDFAQGFWILTNYEDIRTAYQRPDVFSSIGQIVTNPDPEYRMIPSQLDPPEHARYRKLLSAWFSPQAIDRVRPHAEQLARNLVEELATSGSCDFMVEFAEVFPTRVFLPIIGLPVEEAGQLLGWAEKIFANILTPDGRREMLDAISEVRAYFARLLEETRAGGMSAEQSLIAHLATITDSDGRALDDEEIIWICLTVMIGGLDTVKCQLGWIFYHLASHPEDRRRIVGDTDLAASAIEEFLRYYTIANPGRRVVRDVEVGGCTMHAGDSVWLPTGAASRDPRAFPYADSVIIDRTPNKHMAFGAGIHRCLGSHLARMELLTAVRQWHQVIPDYELAAPHLSLRGGVTCLATLPLRWN